MKLWQLGISSLISLLLLSGMNGAIAQTTNNQQTNNNSNQTTDNNNQTTNNSNTNNNTNNNSNDTLNSIDTVLDQVEGNISQAEGVIENTQSGLQQQAQSQTQQRVQGVMQDVLDQNTRETINEAGQTIEQAGGIIDRIGDIGDRIGNLISSFNLESILGILGIDLGETFESVLGGLEGGRSGDVGTTGELNLPDVESAREGIRNATTSLAEEFFGTKTGGEGSVLVKSDLESLLMINTTKEVAEATALSEDGQKTLRANAEAANQALTTSSELAKDSENQDVSQNILRNLSAQMQAQQQTGTLVALDSQLRARDDALRNIIISDTLDEIQGENVAKRRTDASAYSAAITQGGQFILPGVSSGLSEDTP